MSRKDGKRPRNWLRVQERRRLNDIRLRALEFLVDDARKYLPFYQRGNRLVEARVAEQIINQYGPVVDLLREITPEQTSHTWSRGVWTRMLAVVRSMVDSHPDDFPSLRGSK